MSRGERLYRALAAAVGDTETPPQRWIDLDPELRAALEALAFLTDDAHPAAAKAPSDAEGGSDG